MRSWTFAIVVILAHAGTAAAQAGATYRCVDQNGRSTYTNVKEEMTGKRCTLVSREVSVVPVPAPASTSPAAKPPPVPAAKAASTNSRTTERRRILQEELTHEEKRLEEARQKLVEQQSVRSGEERNYQRVLDRLKPYVEAVEHHEKNIGQLRRELSLQ
jgi:hypothetical protein